MALNKCDEMMRLNMTIALLGENADNRDPNNKGRATQAMNAVTLHTINTPEGRFPYV